MTEQPTRVLLVDDQAMVRDGIAVLLSSAPDIDVVGQAADGLEAVARERELQPDVVVMDIRMPNMDGIAATEAILGNRASDEGGSRVLILTTFDHDDYVYDALAAGASGFLLKDAPAKELIEAVRIVARGDALLAPSVTRRLVEDVVRRRRNNQPVNSAVIDALTPRELEVLRLMARGHSNQEIAADLFLAEQTVKTHVGHVLTKLGVRDRTQAVVFAYENGVVQAM